MKRIIVISIIVLAVIVPTVLMFEIECQFYCKNGRHVCFECWGEKVVEIEIEKTCVHCDGKPLDNPCNNNGIGEICDCNCSVYSYCSCKYNSYLESVSFEKYCSRCKGKGILFSKYTCPDCGGDGGYVSWSCNKCNGYGGCYYCGEKGTTTKTEYVDCEACVDGGVICEECGGKGKYTIWEYLFA